jgi:hypothetical protein
VLLSLHLFRVGESKSLDASKEGAFEESSVGDIGNKGSSSGSSQYRWPSRLCSSVLFSSS